MPDQKTVDAFAALIEAGDYVAAMERYYAPTATMQENTNAPREGLATLIEGEKGFLARFDSVKGERLSTAMIGGDQVASVWRYTMTKDGKSSSFEEVSWQTWSGGKIVSERFFYDPASMR